MADRTIAPRRGYDASLRRRRAAETHARIVESAAELFSARGFAGVTLGAIAAQAGVSPDRVRGSGLKHELLLEAFKARYAGEGGWRSILEARSVQQVFAVTDPAEGLEAAIEFLIAGVPRSAHLWEAVRVAAAAHPVVATEFASLNELRVQSFGHTADWMIRIGLIEEPRDAATRDLVAAHLGVVMSHETYLVLAEDHGLDGDAYRAWLREALADLRARWTTS